MGAPDTTLNELLKKIVEDERIQDPNIEIKPFSTDGANYTTTLYLITIEDNKMKKLELFAKVACLGDRMREAMKGDIYATERFVYQDLVNIYEKLQTRNDIPIDDRLKFPKLYACSDKTLDETVILENLVVKGYICHDRLKPVTWEYAAAAVGELAKLHALSYAFAEDDPELFANVAASRKMMMDGNDEHSMEMFNKAATNVIQMLPEDMVKRIYEFMINSFDTDSYNNYLKSIKRPVLVHGDYRPSNLMHRETDGKLDSLIPIDYQTMYAAATVVDLFHFILTATDGEFRKHHFQRLLGHYYNTLAVFLKRLSLDPDTIYSRAQFDEDVKKYMPFSLMSAMVIMPIVFVDAEVAPATDGDAKVTDLVVGPNDIFKKRFIELVNDYIEWKVL